MAFRKEALEEVGGFDEQFRVAGDDVDLCWRIQDAHRTIGFSPAAVVWHHRRTSVRAYWRQQRNYGRAEALLERKWPERYNGVGHVRWTGRVYGNGSGLAWSLRSRGGRIYQGIWGTAPFQSLYEPATSLAAALPLMPEWYLLTVVLAGLTALGAAWMPMFLAGPLLALAVALSVVQAVRSIANTCFGTRPKRSLLALRTLGVALYLIQPLARLSGRVGNGLTPWRRRGKAWVFPRRRRLKMMTELWVDPAQRLHAVESAVRSSGAVAMHGGEYDRWDLEIRGGIFGAARLLMEFEDLLGEAQLVRASIRPRWSLGWLASSVAVAAVLTVAAVEHAWIAFSVLALITVVLGAVGFWETAEACARTLRALDGQRELRIEPETSSTTEHAAAWPPETALVGLRAPNLLRARSPT